MTFDEFNGGVGAEASQQWAEGRARADQHVQAPPFRVQTQRWLHWGLLNRHCKETILYLRADLVVQFLVSLCLFSLPRVSGAAWVSE